MNDRKKSSAPGFGLEQLGGSAKHSLKKGIQEEN